MKMTEVIYFGFELNMLEAHLATHRQLMDRIVVVECARTPGGEPKPLFFADNYDRFRKYDVEHRVLPDETYPNVTKTNVEFIRQERPAKDTMHRIISNEQTDWVFHSDTDEILNPKFFPEIQQRLHEMPREVEVIHHKLDQRSPFVNALYGTNLVHRIYRATNGQGLQAPKQVKRAPLVSTSDGICGWHFTNCYTTAEELYWKIKTRNWLVPEKSMEFCQVIMDRGLLSIPMNRDTDDLVQFIPVNNITTIPLTDLPAFIQENRHLFLRE